MKCEYRNVNLLICTNTDECIRIYREFLLSHEVLILADRHSSKKSLEDLISRFGVSHVMAPSDMGFGNGIVIREFQSYHIRKLAGSRKQFVNEELAILLPTSGSTGSKKYVRISYKNLLENTLSIIDSLGISGEDAAITTLPMNYAYGLSVINTHLYAGARIIATQKSILQKEFWELVNEKGVTSVAGVPYLYELFQRFRLDRISNSVKVFTQAGGKLNPAAMEYMLSYAEKTGKRFAVMYGQTEATARMTCMPKGSERSKFGSAGLPVRNGNIKIANPDGGIGEIIYEGPNVSMGYAATYRDLAKGDENHGRLCTGDMGYVDEDGFVYLTGRKDRIVKYFGKRVDLCEMEERIERECGERAYIVFKNDFFEIYLYGNAKQTDRGKLVSLLEEDMQIYRKTYLITFIGKVPRTLNGKVDYAALAEKSQGD